MMLTLVAPQTFLNRFVGNGSSALSVDGHFGPRTVQVLQSLLNQRPAVSIGPPLPLRCPPLSFWSTFSLATGGSLTLCTDLSRLPSAP